MLYFVDDNLNLLFILKMVYFFSCYSILPKTQVEKVQLMFKREYIYTNIVSTVYRVHFNIDEMELHETKWVLALEYIEVRFVLHPPQIQLFLCLLHLSSRCQCCLHLPPPPSRNSFRAHVKIEKLYIFKHAFTSPNVAVHTIFTERDHYTYKYPLCSGGWWWWRALAIYVLQS